MANPSVAYGFRAVNLIDGSGMPNFGVFRGALINPAAGQKMFYGDVVAPLAGGFFAPATVTGGGAAIGGVAGTYFMWPSLTARQNIRDHWWTGNAADVSPGGQVQLAVEAAQNIVFQVRSAGTSGNPVTAAQVGQNANFIVGAGGNTLNGLSSYALDDNTIGAGATLPFKIYGLVPAPSSDPTSLYNEVYVVINNLTLP